MKKLYFTIILTIVFSGVAYAKQVPISVNEKTIKAEVVNIAPDTIIDTTIVLTENQKTQTANSFRLTAKEKEVSEKVIAGQFIDPNDIGAYVSGLQKMHDKRGLSGDEQNELFLKDKTPKEVNAYLTTKEKKELGI